jgi:hypothetical protein
MDPIRTYYENAAEIEKLKSLKFEDKLEIIKKIVEHFKKKQ